MAAAAVPAISLGAQYFMNRGQNKRTQQALQTSTTGLQDSSAELDKFGTGLGKQAGGFLGDAQKTLTRADSTIGQANNYFAPLVSGSRGAIDQALAPDRAFLTDTYRGASKNLESSGMRGGVRDLARAELNRDRAGRLSLLGPTARASAANGLMQGGQAQAQVGSAQGGIGTNLSGQATGAKTAAMGGRTALAQNAQNMYATNKPYDNQAGGAIGSMIFDAVKSGGKKSGGGGGGLLPSSGPAISGFPGLAPTVPMFRP